MLNPELIRVLPPTILSSTIRKTCVCRSLFSSGHFSCCCFILGIFFRDTTFLVFFPPHSSLLQLSSWIYFLDFLSSFSTYLFYASFLACHSFIWPFLSFFVYLLRYL